MNRFVRLYRDLDRTNRTSEKVAAISAYFSGNDGAATTTTPTIPPDPRDAAWVLALLCGNRLKRVVKHGVVQRAVCDAAAIAPWMLDECHEAVGDFSETAALLLTAARHTGGQVALARPAGADEHVGSPPLHEVIEQWILPLARSPDDQAHARLLEAWSRLPDDHLLVFNKLLRGGFRIGVQRRLVVRALAHAVGVDAGVLEHRLTGSFVPSPSAYLALIRPAASEAGGAPSDSDPDAAARAYPFCLAHQLADPPSSLGAIAGWQLEWKYDGIRAQLVQRPGLMNALLWSRGEELITGTFPEIIAAARGLAPNGGCVLDGEVLAWDPRTGRARSFNALQQRLNRKRVQPGLFDDNAIIFMAFDLLESGGQDLRQLPLSERRERLDQLLADRAIVETGVLRASPLLVCDSWIAAAMQRADARDRENAEGLMLKHRSSVYHSGRRVGALAPAAPGAELDTDDDEPRELPETPDAGAATGWWKWKLDPYAVDAVLLYAQHGSGRRAGLYTDYTFALWSGPEPGQGELTTFAKAYSGLDNDEIRRVDTFVRAHTTARAGPLRRVAPELVFEIGFEGARESTRHTCGLAVRFPRILRWRTDKHAADADTLDAVRRLIRA